MEDSLRKYPLRLDPELFARVSALADGERRSVNSMLNVLIERGLDTWRQDSQRGADGAH